MTDSKRAWWAEDVTSALGFFRVSPESGLTLQQVETNRRLYGKNELPPPPSTSLFRLVLDQFTDLLVLILLGAAVISFVLALFEDSEDRLTAFVEPAVILIILICNAVVGVVQETNAESAISKLKESEAREANVIREGQTQTIHSSEIVPGDILVLAVGDKVPADSRLINLSSATLLVDESMLTGESEAANKHTGIITTPNAVNQDKRNVLFAGTLVVRGKCLAIVYGTGQNTEFGAIAQDLSKEQEKTPLQHKLDEFGEQLSKVIAVICLVVWLMNIGHFTDPDHGSVLKGAIYYFKIAVALAVAAIPEGLPAVVTTCLALGTMKMARKNAIVRSLPSVETLGCTTVICSDKTGTLTTNQMSVQKVLAVEDARAGRLNFREFLVEGDSFAPVGRIVTLGSDGQTTNGRSLLGSDDRALCEIGKISALCNEATLAYRAPEPNKAGAFTKTGAPTEAALLVLAEKIGTPDYKLNEDFANETDPNTRAKATYNYWTRKYERRHMLEFDRDRKSMSVIVQDKETGENWLYCKGAPESTLGKKGVLERCTHIRAANGELVPFTPGGKEAIAQKMASYAAEGLRCLALASIQRVSLDQPFEDSTRYSDIESRMSFCGLVCMLDPPRAQVNQSILSCRTAGIRVIVITGDNKVTAESICRRIGVFHPDEDVSRKSFTGAEFEAMAHAEKMNAVKEAALFSRVEPKHKLEIVTLLKKQGEVVAMTGDGVNDATALLQADIGIAMGSGTDVAREASKMVLQDDNFATIVMAVEEGRSIYANTKQFIRYLISSNIGEVACIFLTALIGMPEALIPVQLLWVNLVTDGLPATALGFNPPDKDIMLRAPRGRTESIINGWTFFRYMAIGIYVGLATVLGFIWWFLYAQDGPHVTYEQLTHFHECFTNMGPDGVGTGLYAGIKCDVFHNAVPSTVSLSILVTIEMFNALNALSENQSLLVVTPFSNFYVIGACALSFILHFIIIYTPFFSDIFHVAPLSQYEWSYVLYLSAPIFLLDEILKFISRSLSGSGGASGEKKED